MKTTRLRHGFAAFTLTELIISIVVAMVLILAVLPMMLRPAHRRPSRINCVNNLKQVCLAFRIWSGDNSDKFPMTVSVAKGGTAEFVPTGLVFPYFAVMSNELNTPKVLHCPADGERTNAVNFTSDFNDWKVSYFVGVDADETKPDTILTGDRNLIINGVAGSRGLVNLWTNTPVGWVTNALHCGYGNVGMADGSVQQFTSAKLREALARTGFGTNRFAVP